MIRRWESGEESTEEISLSMQFAKEQFHHECLIKVMNDGVGAGRFVPLPEGTNVSIKQSDTSRHQVGALKCTKCDFNGQLLQTPHFVASFTTATGKKNRSGQ